MTVLFKDVPKGHGIVRESMDTKDAIGMLEMFGLPYKDSQECFQFTLNEMDHDRNIDKPATPLLTCQR